MSFPAGLQGNIDICQTTKQQNKFVVHTSRVLQLRDTQLCLLVDHEGQFQEQIPMSQMNTSSLCFSYFKHCGWSNWMVRAAFGLWTIYWKPLLYFSCINQHCRSHSIQKMHKSSRCLNLEAPLCLGARQEGLNVTDQINQLQKCTASKCKVVVHTFTFSLTLSASYYPEASSIMVACSS